MEHNGNVSTQRGLVLQTQRHRLGNPTLGSEQTVQPQCCLTQKHRPASQGARGTAFHTAISLHLLTFFGTPCAMQGPGRNLQPPSADAPTSFRPEPIHQDNERRLSGCLRRKLQTFLYKAKDYSVSLLPSTYPWLTLGMCVCLDSLWSCV